MTWRQLEQEAESANRVIGWWVNCVVHADHPGLAAQANGFRP